MLDITTLDNGLRIVNEYEDHGYMRLNINGKKEYKHRLVALQWIQNDDPKKPYIYMDKERECMKEV